MSYWAVLTLGVHKPGVVVHGLMKELKVVAIQLCPSEIHRDPTYVIHQIYLETLQLSSMLVV